MAVPQMKVPMNTHHSTSAMEDARRRLLISPRPSTPRGPAPPPALARTLGAARCVVQQTLCRLRPVHRIRAAARKGQFVVENRPRVAGNIAMAQVAKTAPDGLHRSRDDQRLHCQSGPLYKRRLLRERSEPRPSSMSRPWSSPEQKIRTPKQCWAC